jgi:hypothetical protein
LVSVFWIFRSLIMKRSFQVAVAAFALATSGAALAKSHCVGADGKAVTVEGKTEADQKAACEKVAGAKWGAGDKAKGADTTTKEAKPTDAAPAEGAGTSGGGW